MNMRIVNHRTENGRIFRCSSCNKIHIEFNNLNLNFTDEEFQHFSQYILSIDGIEWTHRNRNLKYNRKIVLQLFNNSSANILLNIAELEEFKSLILNKSITGNSINLINTIDLETPAILN